MLLWLLQDCRLTLGPRGTNYRNYYIEVQLPVHWFEVLRGVLAIYLSLPDILIFGALSFYLYLSSSTIPLLKSRMLSFIFTPTTDGTRLSISKLSYGHPHLGPLPLNRLTRPSWSFKFEDCRVRRRGGGQTYKMQFSIGQLSPPVPHQ